MKKTILALVLFSGSVYAADGSNPESSNVFAALVGKPFTDTWGQKPNSSGFVPIIPGSSLDRGYNDLMSTMFRESAPYAESSRLIRQLSFDSKCRLCAIVGANLQSHSNDAYPLTTKTEVVTAVIDACSQKTA